MGGPAAPEPVRPGGGPGLTVLDVLKASEAWLQKRQIEAPRRSAELLLGRVLGLGRMEVYLAFERPMDESERARMRELLKRRGSGEPIAYILGDWSFRDLELKVTPDVLIPRPETEELVDLVLKVLPESGSVLDLGTGSGAIALALAQERQDARVVATDASDTALGVARENAAAHGLEGRVRFCAGDWWGALAAAGITDGFDVVVSNPPYVDPGQPEHLDQAVRDHEPEMALFTPPGDPGAPYRSIAAGCLAGEGIARLVPGGWLLVESGRGAVDATVAALSDGVPASGGPADGGPADGVPADGVPADGVPADGGGFTGVEVVKDLSGEPRFVRAQRRG